MLDLISFNTDDGVFDEDDNNYATTDREDSQSVVQSNTIQEEPGPEQSQEPDGLAYIPGFTL